LEYKDKLAIEESTIENSVFLNPFSREELPAEDVSA